VCEHKAAARWIPILGMRSVSETKDRWGDHIARVNRRKRWKENAQRQNPNLGLTRYRGTGAVGWPLGRAERFGFCLKKPAFELRQCFARFAMR
jgi:hypothetical protein